MEISWLGFLLLSLYSLIAGTFLGAVYDLIRIQRVLLGVKYSNGTKTDYRNIELPIIKRKAYSLKHRRFSEFVANFFVAAGDVLFVVTSAVVCILVTYAFNSGKVRLTVFFSVACGFLIYYFTVGKLVMRLSEGISFVIRAIFIYLYEIIKWPISKIKKIFLKYRKVNNKKVRGRKS